MDEKNTAVAIATLTDMQSFHRSFMELKSSESVDDASFTSFDAPMMLERAIENMEHLIEQRETAIREAKSMIVAIRSHYVHGNMTIVNDYLTERMAELNNA